MKTLKFSSFVVLISFTLITTSCKKFSCEDHGFLQFDEFIEDWNKETGSISAGSWSLPLWQLPRSGEAKILRHSLDGPNLYIELHVKNTCVYEILIKANRDENIAMASIVAWLKLLKILAPNTSQEDRINFLNNKLNINKPKLKAGGKDRLEGFEFTFSESVNGNELSVKNINNQID